MSTMGAATNPQKLGEKAMADFAVEWLTKLFGSDAAAAVRKTSATRWNSAPYALGAGLRNVKVRGRRPRGRPGRIAT